MNSHGEVLNIRFKKQNTGLFIWRMLVQLCGQSIRIILVFSILSGCSSVSIVGLHPEYPPVEKKTFATYCDFVKVDSLQPTFQWQPFPRLEGNFADRVQDVTYELRIWTTVPGPAGKLKYARDGLELPSHQLKEPLDPSSRYLWSVRARFMVDGHSRVTEWGMAGIPLRYESVPNLSCFRFETSDAHP